MGLLDSIGSAIGVSGGGLFSGLTSLAGGLLGNAGSAQRAREQMDFQERMAGTQYQRAVEDMKAAGINPMLAAKLGGNAAPVGAMAPVSDVVTPALNSARQAEMVNAQVDNINADSASKRADMYLKMAQRDDAVASAAQKMSQTDLNALNTRRVEMELQNIPKEGARLDRTVEMLTEQAKLMAAQGKSQEFIQTQLYATVSKLMAETKLLNFDVQAAMDAGNLARVTRQYGPLAELVINILKSSRR